MQSIREEKSVGEGVEITAGSVSNTLGVTGCTLAIRFSIPETSERLDRFGFELEPGRPTVQTSSRNSHSIHRPRQLRGNQWLRT
ncbi:hypothetical protein C496_22654 [Natronorubrum tibetense GA33]|uniref:Uncharacterized protein n=1 Tax=Natronorubrum tibetense GA33 TaxID=1114856 RepID=L9VI75_9EURY|nr:hypothetical protein C496_22654 [Natronorubrum tibetense GA33]